MVREVNETAFGDKTIERILVCITAQCNSKRLISRAAHIADENNGELHILHVQRGDSLFNNEETPKLLEELFNYGKEKGGMIHFYCDEDIAECIGKFTDDTGITKVVFGQPPTEEGYEEMSVTEKLYPFLRSVSKNVELIVIPRDDTKGNMCIKRI